MRALSIVYAFLRLYLLPVCVFYLPHFGHRVRPLHDVRVGVASCQYKVEKGRLHIYQLEHLRKVEEPQVEGIVDFIEDEEIILG